ncbi:MAG TPA: hypothetical protein DCQ31_16130, partial [Bacteroidales bacterium]|nr:hypothetical protein [Bacteroidales bacterium]
MKKFKIIFALIICLPLLLNAQTGIRNNGAKIIVQQGSTIRVAGTSGNITNASSGLDQGRIALDGVIRLTGNFTNTAGNSVFINPNADGEVQFISSAIQRITGTSSIAFENIWIDNSSNLSVENSISVRNELFLRNGKLLCSNAELKLENGSFLGGINTSKYLILSGTGKLTQWVANNSVAFPVGTSTYYSPANLNNSGVADFYSVGLFGSVTADGTSIGANIPNIENTVKQSWTIEEATAGGSNLTINLQWNSAIEGSLFNRTKAGIGQYTGGVWKAGKATTAFGSNPYLLSIANVTQGGTFAAGDNNTILTDGVPPVLDLVKLYSNQTNTEFVKSGGTVNLLFRANENLKTSPTVSFLSGGKLVSGSVSLIKNAENEYIAQFQPTISDNEGTISFSIGFADVNGNEGISVNATTDLSKVTFDKTLPKFNFVSIYSNAFDKKTAKVGSKITLEFETNELLNSNPTVLFFSNLVSVTAPVTVSKISTLQYKAEVLLGAADLEGSISFKINFSDLSENQGIEITQTTDGSLVNFDKTAPQIITATMSSANKKTHLAKPGNLVSLYFETNEFIQMPAVKIMGKSVTAVQIGNAKQWKADYTMLATDAEGLVPFEISTTDLAGNAGVITTEPTSGSKVLFDKTAPTYAGILIAASFRAQASGSLKINKLGISTDVIYLAPAGTSNFEISNQITSTFGLSESIISPAAEGRYYFYAADEAGNISAPSAAFIDVDATPPIINSVTFTNGNYIPGNKIILKVFTDNSSESYMPSAISVNGISFPNVNLEFVEKSQTEYWLGYTISETDKKVLSGNLSLSISIKDVAGNISNTFSSLPANSIVIDTDRPTGTVRGNATVCEGSITPVFFDLTGNAPWNLSYSNGTQTFVQPGINTSPFRLDVTQTGVFSIVSLTDSESAPGTNFGGSASVTVNPLPNPSFNMLSVYNIADDKVLLSGNPSGGFFSGAGIVESSSNFYPNIAAIGTHTITYTYTEPTSGCKKSVNKTIEVVGAGGSISGLKPLYCYTEPASNITGINPNSKTGTFTISGAKGLKDNGNNTATLTPNLIGAGTFTIYYSYFDITNFVIERTFTVDSVGTVNFIGLSEKYCEKDPLVTLSAIDLYPPNGTGTFSGPPVGFTNIAGGNSAIFDPTVVTANGLPITISYIYKSPGGCLSAPVEKHTMVNKLPIIDFTIQDNYNYYAGSKPLAAVPSGGFFQGSGIIESTFYPSVAGVNPNIPITYNYTNPSTGCANSVTKTTQVRIASGTINNLNAVYCYENTPILITGNPENRIITGTFSDSKNKITDNGDNSALINPSLLGAGKDTITYTYTINGTGYSVSEEIFIDSIGNVNFIGLNAQYCSGEPISNLNAIFSHNSGSGNFTSDISNFINYGNVASFNPATASTSETPFTVEYTYTSTYLNSGCKVKISKQTFVFPLPITSFELKEVYNISQGTQPLNPAPQGGFFTGSGISGINFYPALAGIGSNFQVSYTYSDVVTGCTSILKKLTNVLEAQASISGLNDKNIYCYGESNDTIVGLSSNGLPGGTFAGKGILNLGSDKAVFNPTQAGAGNHVITYEYIGLDAVTVFSLNTTVIVDSIGKVDFVGLNPAKAYCTGSSAVALNGIPAGGVFSGSGTSGYQFLPTDQVIGNNTITYVYTNEYTGCKASVDKTVTVNALPILDFVLDEKMCNNANAIYIKGAP